MINDPLILLLCLITHYRCPNGCNIQVRSSVPSHQVLLEPSFPSVSYILMCILQTSMQEQVCLLKNRMWPLHLIHLSSFPHFIIPKMVVIPEIYCPPLSIGFDWISFNVFPSLDDCLPIGHLLMLYFSSRSLRSVFLGWQREV